MKCRMILILLLLFCFSACGTKAVQGSQGENDYRAVCGFQDGFVAAGNCGLLTQISDDGAHSPIDSGIDADLLCMTGWREEVMIGGSGGTLLRLDAAGNVSEQHLGSSDLVGLQVFQDRLYAVSRSGRLYSSADGSEWSAVKTGLDSVIGLAASDYCLIAVTEESELFVLSEQGSLRFNYNERYKGLYDTLTVHGVGSDPELVWLFGTYENGEPAALHSERGELWFDRPLDVLDSGQTMQKAAERPFAMVYNEQTEYRLLLCAQGKLLLLTDCQECNQLFASQTDALCAGAARDGMLCLVGEDAFVFVGDNLSEA